MAGGGVAFSQALENQGDTNSSEPVVKYGTGGRITGFDKGEIKDLARFGRNGDTMLAHINPQEARMLKRAGGSGTINPITGLPEFMFADDLSDSFAQDGGGGGFGGGDFGGDSFGYGDSDWGDMDSGPGVYDISNPDIPEIEIVDTRPPSEPIDDIPEIEIVSDRPPEEINPSVDTT